MKLSLALPLWSMPGGRECHRRANRKWYPIPPLYYAFSQSQWSVWHAFFASQAQSHPTRMVLFLMRQAEPSPPLTPQAKTDEMLSFYYGARCCEDAAMMSNIPSPSPFPLPAARESCRGPGLTHKLVWCVNTWWRHEDLSMPYVAENLKASTDQTPRWSGGTLVFKWNEGLWYVEQLFPKQSR